MNKKAKEGNGKDRGDRKDKISRRNTEAGKSVGRRANASSAGNYSNGRRRNNKQQSSSQGAANQQANNETANNEANSVQIASAINDIFEEPRKSRERRNYRRPELIPAGGCRRRSRRRRKIYTNDVSWWTKRDYISESSDN